MSVLAIAISGIGYLLYTSMYLPRAIAREFLGLLVADRIAEAHGRIDPASRSSYGVERVREWAGAVKGYDDIDWGRKSSMGTTRGGRTTAHSSGYLRYPNSKAERSFSINIIKDDGTWWISSFSVGSLAEPR